MNRRTCRCGRQIVFMGGSWIHNSTRDPDCFACPAGGEHAPAERVYADDREESEPCERCTPGCSINHRLDPNDECATW